MTQAVELFERAVVATEKLVNEVARLRVDVIRLHGRIEPFEGEPSRPYPDEIRGLKTLPDVIAAISEIRAYIIALERDTSRIRSVIDSIDVDAVSREEMKPFLRTTKS